MLTVSTSPRTTILYVAWQDEASNNWHPIGILRHEHGEYEFRYVAGVRRGQPVFSFPELHARYVSKAHFPFFANRLMSPKRPDYPEYMEHLGLDAKTSSSLTILGRYGRRFTDPYFTFPYPDGHPGGLYEARFFLDRQGAVEMQPGQRLICGAEVPAYLREDVEKCGGSPEIIVEQVNQPPAATVLRVLCRLRMPWPIGFEPFSGPEYQPIASAALQPRKSATSAASRRQSPQGDPDTFPAPRARPS